MSALTDSFYNSGLEHIEGRAIKIRLDFKTFDDFWTSQAPHALSRCDTQLTDRVIKRLRSLLGESLRPDQNGRITHMAGANAVRSIVKKRRSAE